MQPVYAISKFCHFYHYKWEEVLEIPFVRFWKMYKAINVIRLDLLFEAELKIDTAINNGDKEAGSEITDTLETALIRIPYVRPAEERKRDAKNARLQFKQMNRKLRESMRKTEEEYKKKEKKRHV